MIAKNDVVGLLKSFTYAFKGIAYCIKNERNIRIHMCMTALVSVFAYFYKVTSTQYILLLLCIGFVLSAEMVNTAIETLTNLESPSYNPLARIAKDVAAGAVFVAATVAMVVGLIIFLKPKKLLETLQMIVQNPLYLGIFVLLILMSILFTFNGAHLFGEPKTRVYKLRNYTKK